MQSCSVFGMNYNYNILEREGYPHKQIIAILYDIARKNIHKCDLERREAIRRGYLFSKRVY